MTTYYSPDEQRAKIAEVIATFPATFGLRAFPGEVFRLSLDASYFVDTTATKLHLYTQRKAGDQWLCFCKGEPDELRREVRP